METETARPLPQAAAGMMSSDLPDPDSLLTPGGTPVDAVNSVLSGLNPTANGLNGTPTRKDSGEEAGPGEDSRGMEELLR